MKNLKCFIPSSALKRFLFEVVLIAFFFLFAFVGNAFSQSYQKVGQSKDKPVWFGKCSKKSKKQKSFSAKFLEDIRVLPAHQKRQGDLANWQKVQKQDKAKRQRMLTRQRNKTEWQRTLTTYRSSAIRN